jgi:uncharacterized membrane protein YciS (DUF1049 family)
MITPVIAFFLGMSCGAIVLTILVLRSQLRDMPLKRCKRCTEFLILESGKIQCRKCGWTSDRDVLSRSFGYKEL